ncbi:MAG: hypothetical protein CK425_01970 [Parachlamydia sp.]|nr:MAG: hypothetical protein CK425_01970 [Parachlamydia sp.]
MLRTLQLVLFITISFTGCCDEQCHAKFPLPDVFLFEGQPIPDAILENFFGTAVAGFGAPNLKLNILKSLAEYDQKKINTSDTFDEGSESEGCYQPRTVFEWEYVGPIHKSFHVVRAYTWEVGCLGKFTGILILKREGNIIQIVDIIYGGDRHSSMIFEGCRIQEDLIVYSQAVTTGNIVDEAIAQHPEIMEICPKTHWKNICYGEAGYYGSFEKTAKISPEGKVRKIHLIRFIPCAGSEKDGEIYAKGGLKAIALDLLADEAKEK